MTDNLNKILYNRRFKHAENVSINILANDTLTSDHVIFTVVANKFTCVNDPRTGRAQ